MTGGPEPYLPTIVVLGFLVGMRHALEADHLAAVATLARESRGVWDSAFRGAVWGLGHTLTLFLVGGACLLLGGVVPDGFARAAEAGVGAMLVALGLQVFLRMRRRGVLGPASDPQPAEPRAPGHRRALVIGLVHGLAGSAALLLLALEATPSPWLGLLYIAIFGLGSVGGMAVLSAALAVPFATPLRRQARDQAHDQSRWPHRLHRGLEAAVGVAAVAVGLWVLVEVVVP